jgi:hypothetical protein
MGLDSGTRTVRVHPLADPITSAVKAISIHSSIHGTILSFQAAFKPLEKSESHRRDDSFEHRIMPSSPSSG